VLPLVPPDEEYFSPYSGQDALCGNPLLISLEQLVEQGLLSKGVPFLPGLCLRSALLGCGCSCCGSQACLCDVVTNSLLQTY
jgi:hypothetical protein